MASITSEVQDFILASTTQVRRLQTPLIEEGFSAKDFLK